MPLDITLINQDKYLLKTPDEFMQMSGLAVNWINQFLNDIVEKQKRKARIFEYGSGLSTVWFAQNLKDVDIYSLEGDKNWHQRVRDWLKERQVEDKVNYLFEEQTAMYTLNEETVNENYIKAIDIPKFSFDIILNDGALREYVGEYILENADRLIEVGGLYLRHDYEQAINRNWLGYTKKDWPEKPFKLGYDLFCSTRQNYEMITVAGNGKWGYMCELGGIWHRL